MAVDYGNDSYKVSLIQPGRPIEIASNVFSKRKTPNVLSFFEPTRVFANDAELHEVRGRDKVFVMANNMLGKQMKDKKEDVLGLHTDYYPLRVNLNETRQTVSLNVGETGMHPEELHAHNFAYAKKMAEAANDNIPITEAVITIPADANQATRKAYYNAALIAGLRPTLVHTTVAAGVQRALDWAMNKTTTYLFYNLGARSTEVCVFEFFHRETGMVAGRTAPAVQVKSCVVDDKMGGHFADIIIANFMKEKFKTLHPKLAGEVEKLRSHKKLLSQAKKTKLILSANKQAPFQIQSFVEDTDFLAEIKRSEFDDLLDNSGFSELTNVVQKAMSQANITKADIDQVELIGGSWRIPKIFDTLDKYFKNPEKPDLELGQHLNGEESPALGAALFGANMSSVFRVRRIFLQDVVRHDYFMEIDSMTGEQIRNRTQLAVKFQNKLNFKKKITFAVEENFRLKLFENENLLSTHDFDIATSYGVYKDKENCTRKVSFTIAADLSGIISVSKAEYITEEPYVEQVLDEVMMKIKKLQLEMERKREKEGEKKDGEEGEKKEGEEGEKKEGEEEEKKEGEEKEKKEGEEEEKKEGEEGEEKKEGEDKDGEKKEGEGKDGEKKDEKKKDKKKEKEPEIKVDPIYKNETKRRKHAILTLVNTTYSYPLPLTDHDIEIGKKSLARMEQIDQEAQQMNEVKNELEATVYAYREKLEDKSVIKCSKEEDREEIMKMSTELSDFLEYETGGDLPTLKEKLSKFKGLMEPILERAKEEKERKNLGEKIKEQLDAVEALQKEVKRMVWLNETKVEAAKEKVAEFKKWWEEAQEKQKALPANETPYFTVDEVKEKADKLVKTWTKLSKTKKPKEPKAGEPKKKVFDMKPFKTEELVNERLTKAREEKSKAVEEERYEDADTAKNIVNLLEDRLEKIKSGEYDPVKEEEKEKEELKRKEEEEKARKEEEKKKKEEEKAKRKEDEKKKKEEKEKKKKDKKDKKDKKKDKSEL